MKYEQILISYMYMYTRSTYTVRVTCSAAFSTLPGVGISSYIVIDTGENEFWFFRAAGIFSLIFGNLTKKNFIARAGPIYLRVQSFRKKFSLVFYEAANCAYSRQIVILFCWFLFFWNFVFTKKNFVTFLRFGFPTRTRSGYKIITNLPSHFIIGFMSKAVIT